MDKAEKRKIYDNFLKEGMRPSDALMKIEGMESSERSKSLREEAAESPKYRRDLAKAKPAPVNKPAKKSGWRGAFDALTNFTSQSALVDRPNQQHHPQKQSKQQPRRQNEDAFGLGVELDLPDIFGGGQQRRAKPQQHHKKKPQKKSKGGKGKDIHIHIG